MSKPLRYPIPAAQTQVETEVKRSRFIATAAYAPTVEEAQRWLADLRKEYRDARHNCPAYRIGYGTHVEEWANDDGEPQGTAGRPILSVIQSQDIGDIVVMVTRYFGGIKLGTGGLVRAYSGAVRALFEVLPTKLLVARCNRILSVPYAQYERIKSFLAEYEALILDEDFAADVTLTFSLPLDQREAFDAALTELSHGALEALDLEEDG